MKAYAPKIDGHRVWVRVNGLETGLAEADLDAVIGVEGIAGIFLPKVETRDEVLRWDAHDRRAGDSARARRRRDPACALDRERARRAQRLRHVAGGAARRVALLRRRAGRRPQHRSRLRLVERRAGDDARALPRAAAARAARFDSPLDGVFADVRDPEGFEKDTALSRRLGYRGRKLIHPSQIEPCNRLYAPSQSELDYYARVLEAFDKALAQGSATTTVDGKMIDVAMAERRAARAATRPRRVKKAG